MTTLHKDLYIKRLETENSRFKLENSRLGAENSRLKTDIAKLLQAQEEAQSKSSQDQEQDQNEQDEQQTLGGRASSRRNCFITRRGSIIENTVGMYEYNIRSYYGARLI